MRYHITKLDARHNYHKHFQYYIEFSKRTWVGTGVLDFDRSRRWFNEKYGWGQDVEVREAMLKNREYGTNGIHYQLNDINSFWAYSIKYSSYRIYIATDQELGFFIMSHPNAT